MYIIYKSVWFVLLCRVFNEKKSKLYYCVELKLTQNSKKWWISWSDQNKYVTVTHMYIITIKNDKSYYTVNSHVCLVTHLNWEHQQAGLVAYLIKLYKQFISWMNTWVYTQDSLVYRIIIMLEIKPCWLGSIDPEIWRCLGIASSCCLSQPQLWGRRSKGCIFTWGCSSNLIGPAKGFKRLLSNFY